MNIRFHIVLSTEISLENSDIAPKIMKSIHRTVDTFWISKTAETF